MMDSIDRTILATLATQGRITWAELGAVLDLSAPATAERVRRLEAQGIIRGYSARLNAVELGFSVTAFIAVTLERPRYRRAFLELTDGLPEIQECHHIAGDHDYLLKVRCRDPLDLERIIGELKELKGVSRTRTTMVLSTAKETAALPLATAPTDNR